MQPTGENWRNQLNTHFLAFRKDLLLIDCKFREAAVQLKQSESQAAAREVISNFIDQVTSKCAALLTRILELPDQPEPSDEPKPKPSLQPITPGDQQDTSKQP